MKKVLSTMLAALVAVSFSGMVFAAEVPKSDAMSHSTTVAPGGEVKAVKKEAKKSVKKQKKHQKKHENLVIKKVEPAPVGPLPPATK